MRARRANARITRFGLQSSTEVPENEQIKEIKAQPSLLEHIHQKNVEVKKPDESGNLFDNPPVESPRSHSSNSD